jgi:hypothetical protein
MRDHPIALAILLAAGFIGVRCTAACAPMPGPEPLPPVDAGACSDGTHDACDLAAMHLCQMGCGFTGSSGIDRQWGTADDDTFAEACRVISFNTTCLASARTCAEAEQCE